MSVVLCLCFASNHSRNFRQLLVFVLIIFFSFLFVQKNHFNFGQNFKKHYRLAVPRRWRVSAFGQSDGRIRAGFFAGGEDGEDGV